MLGFMLYNVLFDGNLTLCHSIAADKNLWVIQGKTVDWAGISHQTLSISPTVSLTKYHDSVVISAGGNTGIFDEYKQLVDGIVHEITAGKAKNK